MAAAALDRRAAAGHNLAMVILKAVGIWFVLAVVAVANGIARQALLSPHMADLPAHQISTATGSVLIFLTTLALIPWLGIRGTGQLLGIGALWLGMTVAFEFGFGHYVASHPWERLLADYNILRGRVWILILAVIFIAPLAAARVRGL